ncbi:replication factor C subunit 1-like [Mobula hypostoma]|uniref:replication factor C subunit 1-like n=1 Tax=Mobula hypostoma TaxID=723540 RepID=UPI002FC3D800
MSFQRTWRPMIKQAKVKAAFTRTYNKETHLTPYALQAIKKLKHGSGAGSSLDSELNDDSQTEDVQADEAEDNLEMGGMIKMLLDMLRISSILTRKSEDTGSQSNTHKTLEELSRLGSLYRNE